jgi:hypothetical protein
VQFGQRLLANAGTFNFGLLGYGGEFFESLGSGDDLLGTLDDPLCTVLQASLERSFAQNRT